MPVALAVRASSTIPIVFTPTLIDSDGDGIDEMFVDGGLLRNMPVDTPGTGEMNEVPSPADRPTGEGSDGAGVILALGLRSKRLQLFGDAKPISSLTEFVSRLYGAIVWGPDTANSLLATQQSNVEYRNIDTRGVSGRDFSLAASQKRELVSSGFLAVMEQLLRCGRADWPQASAFIGAR